MRRWARRLGFGTAALVGGVIAATALTARSGDPAIWPPRTGADTIEIFVVSNGYHTGVALPRAALAETASRRGHGALIAVTQRFAYPWIEIGWGDEGFYRQVPTVNDLTLPIALRALFRPGNPSVLHVVGVATDPAAVFPQAELVAIPLSAAGFERLAAKLDATFARPDGTALQDLGKGLYGPSLFYPAVGRFSILRVCNHWIANLLDAAGLPTTPVLATLSPGLMLDLRWRAGLQAKPPAGSKGTT
jgi:uncharacterized protein (TIGR02117 family)